MKREALRVIADSMQAGNLCPTCQKPIAAGEAIVSCMNCGAMNHEVCWESTGCGSYHCRPAASFLSPQTPDFVLSKEDVNRVSLPPVGRLHTTQALAREVDTLSPRWGVCPPKAMDGVSLGGLSPRWGVCPPKAMDGVSLGGLSSHRNNFALSGFFTSTVCFALAIGFSEFIEPTDGGYIPLFLGVMISGALAVAASILGIVTSQLDRRQTHNRFALIGLLVASCSMGLGILSLSPHGSDDGELMAPVRFEAGKVKDFIARADNRIRGPLMCNVHVSVKHGFSSESQGSGVILRTTDQSMYILSNLHVITAGKVAHDLESVKKGPRIVLTFYTGDKRIAEPIWMAPYGIDLIVLQVPLVNGVHSSSKVQSLSLVAVGQKVFAIGNPMGLNWSYTEGVISGLRTQQFGPHELTVIQMQTPLNPGNSGGGLYDQDGFLVGINTWIYAKSKSEGLNFSLSVEGLLKVLDPGLKQILALESPIDKTGGPHDGQAETPSGRLQQNR